MAVIKKIVYTVLNFFGLNILTKKQKRLLNKYSTNPSKNIDSIIFFTSHKAASNFSNEILKEIEKNSDYVLYDYGALIGSLADKLEVNNFEEFLNYNYKFLFSPLGEIYGPQRMPIEFPGLNDYKKIFFLRDPRDVLVSAYYSFGYTHVEPDSKKILKEFNLKRNEIQKQTIDEFVLKQSKEWIKPLYMDYKSIKESTNKEVLYLTYNQYVENPKKFVCEIFDFFKIHNQDSINFLTKIANPITEIKKSYQHKRSGKNNQWETDLLESTQIKLNNDLNEILKYWKFC